MYFHCSCIISPLRKVGSFICSNLNPLYPMMFYVKFGWNWPSGSEEEFLFSSMYFCYLSSSPFGIGSGSLVLYLNLNPLYPRMLCAKFGWDWPSRSGEDFFKILSVYFRYFVIISPWKGRGPLFQQTWIPSHKDALFQVWLKLAYWIWRRQWNVKSL